MITIHVVGTPAPKGSPKVVTRGRDGKPLPFPRVLADSEKTRSWAAEVATQAAIVMRDCNHRPFARKALRVLIEFRFARPSGHHGPRGLKRSAPLYPAVKPDLDKIVRTTLDALHGVVFDDDSRIVSLNAVKRYATSGHPSGAYIGIEAVKL